MRHQNPLRELHDLQSVPEMRELPKGPRLMFISKMRRWPALPSSSSGARRPARRGTHKQTKLPKQRKQDIGQGQLLRCQLHQIGMNHNKLEAPQSASQNKDKGKDANNVQRNRMNSIFVI